jgi:hypothetical protein
MKKHLLYAVLLQLSLSLIAVQGQQVPDFDFDPEINNPAYPDHNGPVVVVDEAHHNFHTIATRYNAFAKVLTREGYVVKPGTQVFTKEGLKGVKILVIANALHASNEKEWSKPIPSAFTKEEIDVVNQWVKNGGSLFLIADHMPFPAANEALAGSFGFTFYDGFATDTTTGIFPGAKKELDIFRKSDKTLASHEITGGGASGRGLDHVATFTGQGFEIPQKAVSLLTFNDKYKVLLPDTAWKFSAATHRIPVKGFSQGAVLEYGKGRISVFGEAAMFSSQLKGKNKEPFGLRSPDADQNLTFLRNIIRWLDGRKAQ